MNDTIAKNIRKYRELRGFSQEYMAHHLDVNQASYAKLESGVTKITIDRLFSIGKLLETEISEILDLKNQTIYNQDLKDNAVGHQQVENLYQDNKAVYEKLIQAKDEQITFLKEMLLGKGKF